MLRARGLHAPRRDARVFDAWSDAVGASLRKHARPVRFRDAELLVEVSSSAHLAELRAFTGEELRRRVNEALGTEAVERLAFKLDAPRR